LEEESYTANKDNSRLIKYPRIFVMPKEWYGYIKRIREVDWSS
jgi:hypothetical protein